MILRKVSHFIISDIRNPERQGEWLIKRSTASKACQRLWVLFLPPVKNLGNFNEENVIMPSVTVTSEDYLSSVHVLLYTTALERDCAITVSVDIHAMAFKNFSPQKIEAAGQMKGYVTLECVISTACLRQSLSCPQLLRLIAPWE